MRTGLQPQQGATRRLLPALIVVLSAVLVAALLWKLQPIIWPDRLETAPVATGCDLHSESCSTSFNDGTRVSLSINPRPIPILEKLRLEVGLTDVMANKVEVDIVGVGMNMGYNRPLLQKSGNNLYTGEAVLPVCVLDEMAWEARIMVHTDSGLKVAPFQFVTRKLP